jgi:hypothetical protein
MYKIIHKRYVESLEKEVNYYISKGWVPLGGVSISIVPPTKYTEETVKVVQAMVKE